MKYMEFVLYCFFGGTARFGGFILDQFTIYYQFCQKKKIMHKNIVPIHIEDANQEIMARIVKVASHKYNCDVEIDFS